MRYVKILLAGTFALGLVTAACASDDATSEADAVTTVAVTATEYGYSGVDELSSGTTAFTLSNAGEEMHDMAVIEGEPPEDPEALTGGGALFTAPGTTAPTNLVVDLTPGTWTFICFLETEDGTPHAELGMIQTIEVT